MIAMPDPEEQLELIPLSKAAKILGVSPTTLYRYEKKGLLKPHRTPGGHRRYNLGQLKRFLYTAMTPETTKPEIQRHQGKGGEK